MRIFLRIKGLGQRKEYFKRTEWDTAEYSLGSKIIFACYWEKELNEVRNAWYEGLMSQTWGVWTSLNILNKCKASLKLRTKTTKFNSIEDKESERSQWRKSPEEQKLRHEDAEKNLILKEMCIFLLFSPFFFSFVLSLPPFLLPSSQTLCLFLSFNNIKHMWGATGDRF